MSDFNCDQLKSNKCTFELYMNSEIKPSEYSANLNIEKVPVLLEELKEVYDLDCEIKDTQKMSPKKIKDAYDVSAHWAQNLNRPYGKSRKIYEIFCSAEKGDLFGKKIPALIVRDSSGGIICVLPHIAKQKTFSLRNYVQKRKSSYQEQKTITIFDFLTGLKNSL